MEPKNIEITQEMLEQALLCCLEEHYPCEDCYLYPLRGDDDDCMPDGTMCSKRLALDAIAYIRKINDFEHSQCAKLLQKLEEERMENGQLRAVIKQIDPDFFKKKCRVCGCNWNHPCNDHDFWVEDDLCSACAAEAGELPPGVELPVDPGTGDIIYDETDEELFEGGEPTEEADHEKA